MTYNLSELSQKELYILALAMDFYLSNSTLSDSVLELAEALLCTLDDAVDETFHIDKTSRIISSESNLLKIDFDPKND